MNENIALIKRQIAAQLAEYAAEIEAYATFMREQRQQRRRFRCQSLPEGDPLAGAHAVQNKVAVLMATKRTKTTADSGKGSQAPSQPPTPPKSPLPF